MKAHKLPIIVLDMDGVLIDTIPSLKRALSLFIEEFGGTYSDSLFESLNGNSLNQIIEKLKIKFFLKEPLSTLEEYYQSLLENIHDRAKLNEGVFEAIDLCNHWGIDICLVTGASSIQASTILKKYKLKKSFSHIVSADDVEMGKPAPDLFLKLKKNYNTNRSFYVFDDAINGVIAAKEAGMDAFLFTNEENKKYKTISDFQEISQFILQKILDDKKFISAKNCKIISRSIKSPISKPAEEYWKKFKSEHPNSFNGSFLTATNLKIQKKEIEIDAICSDYKQTVYMKKYWPLFKNINPFTLAVSAVVRNEKGDFLIGKREISMNNYPNYYELVGSGNLTCKHSPEIQLTIELKEECNIKTKDIKNIEFIGLVIDNKANIVDLCYEVLVAGCKLPKKTAEYDKLQFVANKTLANIQKSEAFVPTTMSLLSLYL